MSKTIVKRSQVFGASAKVVSMNGNRTVVKMSLLVVFHTTPFKWKDKRNTSQNNKKHYHITRIFYELHLIICSKYNRNSREFLIL